MEKRKMKRIMKYERNLKNGLLNGIVKEYNEWELIFEGEYLNDKKKWKRKRI